jgi:hypothetical protein
VKKIYLAGPMTNIPFFNFPAFKSAAYTLRKQGYFVFNPAERDVLRHGGIDISLNNPTGCARQCVADHNFSLEDALMDDLEFIIRGGCTTIAFLPGWENSGGAVLEWTAAKHFKREFMYL